MTPTRSHSPDRGSWMSTRWPITSAPWGELSRRTALLLRRGPGVTVVRRSLPAVGEAPVARLHGDLSGWPNST